MFVWFFKDTATVNSTSNKKEEEYDGLTKPVKVLKEGSVLDILKNPGKTMNSFFKRPCEKYMSIDL